MEIALKDIGLENTQAFFDIFIPSRKWQHLLIQNQDIKIDGQPLKRDSVFRGKQLELCLYPELYTYEHYKKEKPVVIYEDEIFLIVYKPCGLLVHDDGQGKDCLQKAVEGYLYDKKEEYCLAKPLHRLDVDTQGLVAFAKSPVMQPLLDSMLAQKMIRRRYLAIVSGKINKGTRFIIDKPLGRDRHNAAKMLVYKNGQKALTKAVSLGFSKRGYSILDCRIMTGRTHQIRVHLSSEGYPILNDKLYGKKSDIMKNMGLLAYELTFYHPFKEEEMVIKAPLWGEFRHLMEEIAYEED